MEPGILASVTSLSIRKRAISNPQLLNEAYDYSKPSSFSRGMRIDLNRIGDPADLRHGQY